MQSHLTRRVFRALINNEPLRFSQCHRNRLLHTIAPLRVRGPLPGLPHMSRRTLFSFNTSQNTEADSTTLQSEKGLKPMADLMRSLVGRNRPPPNEVLAKAFQVFFATRLETPGIINLFQARLLNTTWKHLKKQQSELEEKEFQNVFSIENLEKMLYVLNECEVPQEARETVLRIGRFAYLELCADHGFGANKISREAIILYVNLTAMNGNPEEARHTVLKYMGQMRNARPSPWLTVLKGFALKDDMRLVRQIVQDFEKHGNEFDSNSHLELLKFLIGQDQLHAVQTVYNFSISGQPEPSLAAKEAVIKYCIFKSQLEWASTIYETLPRHPSSETARIMLLWEAAQESNASDIALKADTWVANNPSLKTSITIETINDLLKLANVLDRPQLTADFMKLSEKWGLTPNEQSYSLQMESHIQAGNVKETLELLEDKVDPASLATANLPLANKLITMLCRSEEKDALFQQISSLLDPLFQDNVRLDPKTVAALTHMLLYRHDLEAVSDLLRPRLGDYDDEMKMLVRTALTDFILDMNQADTEVSNAYELLKIAFPETGVPMRTKIMSSFFERERSDLAVQVFGHMRQAEQWARRPRPDTYARCFQGLSRTADATNLELVHNMLKLDTQVDLTTRILNGLMMAYTACEMPEKSMDIFRQILQSEEGPTRHTIRIFFKVCEKHHNGAQEALKMFSKVKKLEISLDRPLYSAYMEAVAAQCEFDLATEVINNMEAEVGVLPTSNTIGLFYNAIPYQYWKDDVEKWAIEKYPELWEHLVKTNRTEHEEGLKFDGIVNEVVI
ncbi:uncharacterized protein N7511_005893 [Penicillium nucicola]|uniref:uncharacterized protein n=1 Tax=Penicillium nucicola TaxID=1850975 RepID=UPI002544F5D2|nr:uncharacterized protein N7511_005893 [Penicillium nucicola]KAJ5762511.1 hypothetical protein N7511_005893 [Penicillium nucicola]